VFNPLIKIFSTI